MKKLLYFVVSVLSLGVIFAAGWASAVGTVTRGEEQPVVRSGESIDDCKDGDKCPYGDDCPENYNIHRHGFRMKIPFPPIDRDTIIRLPKTVS